MNVEAKTPPIVINPPIMQQPQGGKYFIKNGAMGMNSAWETVWMTKMMLVSSRDTGPSTLLR